MSATFGRASVADVNVLDLGAEIASRLNGHLLRVVDRTCVFCKSEGDHRWIIVALEPDVGALYQIEGSPLGCVIATCCAACEAAYRADPSGRRKLLLELVGTAYDRAGEAN